MNKYLPDPLLQQLRAGLIKEESLMRGGIFTDTDTNRPYFTGYSYKTLYDWDQYFESIVQVYMGWPSDTIRNGVTIFLDHQQDSGMISRSVPSNQYHDPEHVKPFLSQIALLVQKAYGEIDWILRDHYFQRLQKYLDFWLVQMDGNQNGLSEWMSAPHTGMDNQHERAGYWLDRFSEGVDLNCYLVRECRAFARLCDFKGAAQLGTAYRSKADELAERIRRKMWDEQDGFFYDHNARYKQGLKSTAAGWAAALNAENHELIRVKSVAAFAVLWAGVASKEQAERMVLDHLFNSQEFWTASPVPALSRSERWYSQDFMPADLGCNWRANTWIPTNYMIYHGLRNYGYRDLAALVAHKTVELVQKAGNREYYNSETGGGCGLDPFWGWSLLAHFLPYEEASGNDTDINSLE
jgi:putative isomerase